MSRALTAPKYQSLLAAHRDLDPDTPLAAWESSLDLYRDLAPVRHLAEDVVMVSGYRALRAILQDRAPSFDYIIKASPDAANAPAHRCMTRFGLDDMPVSRSTRKARAMRAVSDVVRDQGAALAVWVQACFQRAARSGTPVDLQLDFAIPLALGGLAIAHGTPPEQRDLLFRVFPALARMRHLFDFVRHDQAIAEADDICAALMEVIDINRSYYQDHAPPGGFFAALRARGEPNPHAPLAALQLAGTSSVAEMLRWMLWKESSDPGFLPVLRAQGRSRSFALNMLRLYPPQPLAYREVTQPADLEGVALTPGTKVFCNLIASLRDHRVMDQPGAFSARNAPYARLVFGAGSRRCAGMSYAVEMVHLALAARAGLPGRFEVLPKQPDPTIGLFRDASAGNFALSYRP